MPNIINNWPYTDLHNINLDWVLTTLKEKVAEINAQIDKIKVNTADIAVIKWQIKQLENEIAQLEQSGFMPIFCGDWNNTTAYLKWSLVYDSNTGNSYMAVQNVPAGIPLTNTTYWQISADYSAQIATVNADIDALKARCTALEAAAYLPDSKETLWISPHMFMDDLGVQPQGSCIIELGGVQYLYQIFYYGNNSDDVLRKIDMSTGNTVLTLTGHNFGHGNGMAYDPDSGIIYIARGGGAVPNDDYLDMVRATTLDYLGQVQTAHTVLSVAYNDGKLYCSEGVGTHTVYVYDPADTMTPLETIILDPGDSLWNAIEVDDNFIYMATMRNGDYGLDGVAIYYKDGSIKGWAELPTTLEIENIIALPDGNYYATFYTAGGMLGAYCSPLENLYTYGKPMRSKYRRIRTSNSTTTYYLDSTYTGNLVDGSAAHPFRKYNLAIQCAFYTGMIKLSLNVTGDFSNDIFRIAMGQQLQEIEITGTGTIGGYHQIGGKATISDITIMDLLKVDGYQGYADVYNGSAIFSNVTFPVAGGSGYGIYVIYGDADVQGCTFDCNTGIFSNTNSIVRVDPTNVFNCASRYFRSGNGGRIHMQQVPLAYAVKSPTISDFANSITGTCMLAAADDFATARLPISYIASTAAIASNVTGVPATAGPFRIEATVGTTIGNINATFYGDDGTVAQGTLVSGTWTWHTYTTT